MVVRPSGLFLGTLSHGLGHRRRRAGRSHRRIDAPRHRRRRPRRTASDDADELVAPGSTGRSALDQIERRRADRRPWEAAAPWFIAVGTLVLRLLTAANGPTDWDSAQYASAVGHFDVTHGQPQPPGYWLYVMAGRLIHQVSGLGTIHSLVLVAAVASAAAAGLTTVAGTDLGGPWVGLAAGLVVTTCPFAWFSGSIVATYSFDMVGCSLLVILAWRARPGSWHGVAAVVALGVLAGFRQSMIQSFAVLALIPVVASTRRWGRLGLTIVAGAAAVGVWLIPMSLSQAGGFSAWARATRTEATGAAHATSVLDHAAAGATNLGTFAAYHRGGPGPAGTPGPPGRRRARVETPGSQGPRQFPSIRRRVWPGHGFDRARRTSRWSAPGTRGGRPFSLPPSSPRCCWWPSSSSPRGVPAGLLPAAVIALLLPVGALNWKALGGRSVTAGVAGDHLGRRGGDRCPRRPTVLGRRRGAPRTVRGVFGRAVVRPAALSGPLHRHATRHHGCRRLRHRTARPRSVGPCR